MNATALTRPEPPWYLVPGVLLIIPGLLYGLTMPREITLEDAGLFQMVCQLGGISHPPGYPLFTLLCGPLTFGSSVMAGNAVSSLFAVLALWLFYAIVRRLTGNWLLALVAALAYGASNSFWSQAIIIEVYTLAVLNFMLCWLLLIEFRNSGNQTAWLAFCFSAGLALTNHWPLFILSCLGFLPLLYGARHSLLAMARQPWLWLGSFSLLLLGLSPYLQLVLQQDPVIAVHGPVQDGTFWKYVSRAYYSDTIEGSSLQDKLQFFAWLLPTAFLQLGLVALPLVLIGLVTSFKRLGLEAALSLLGVFLATTWLLMALVDFRFEVLYQGIFRPYPVIAYAAIAFWFALGLEWVTGYLELGRFGRWSLSIAAFALLTVVIYNHPKVDRSQSTIAGEYARLVLQNLPKDAILVVGGDNQLGPVGFLNRVQGVRPDVTVYSDNGLVFNNRLAPPFASEATHMRAINELVATTSRPVFALAPLPGTRTSFGLFYGFEPGPEPRVFLPAVGRYLDYLLYVHLNDLLTDYHERQFTYDALAQLSEHYVVHLLETGPDGFDGLELKRLEALQATFPGKLRTLEHLFHSGIPVDTERWLELALAAEAQMKTDYRRHHQAVIYEYVGLLYQAQGKRDKAEGYYRAAVASMPERGNLAICHLRLLLEKSGRSSEATKFMADWPVETCTNYRDPFQVRLQENPVSA